MLMLLGACAPAAPPGGAWLRVANGSDLALLDPQLAVRSADLRVLGALHAGLTRLDPQTLEALPDLAEEFRSEDLGRIWHFRLREELRWSDGSPLTGEDFLASWERLRAPGTASPYGGWLADAAWTLEGRQLEVRFPWPMPMFDQLCAFPALAPLPAALREAESGTVPRPVVGAGPYRLIERRVRHRVRVERNPHSHRAANIALDGIDFLTVESQFTALNLFLADEVELLFEVPALAVDTLAEEQPQAFAPAPLFAALFLRANVQDSAFRSPALRRAMSLAIDRQRLAATVGGGRDGATSFVPPLIEGYPHAKASLYDPERARKEFAAALLELQVQSIDELPPLELLYPSSERNRDVAEALQAQWQEVLGVQVRLANQEGRTFTTAQNKLQYQLSVSSWIGDYLDPLTFLEIFVGGHGSNRTGWADPRYAKLLDAAAQAEDAAERFARLAQAEQLLLQEAVVFPLLVDRGMELVSPRLSGYARNARGLVDWASLSLTAETTP